MHKSSMTVPELSILISCLAVAISAGTAWLTFFRRGTVRMTKPTVVYFGPDGGGHGEPKVYIRALLYSTGTSNRGRIIESMFVRLRRGESSQTFNVWTHGEGTLVRGSGLFVGPTGVALNHHFLPPEDGTQYVFMSGEYVMEVHASLVGAQRNLCLASLRLTLSEQHARAMVGIDSGAYFDWGPDSNRYHPHVRQGQVDAFLEMHGPKRST